MPYFRYQNKENDMETFNITSTNLELISYFNKDNRFRAFLTPKDAEDYKTMRDNLIADYGKADVRNFGKLVQAELESQM